MGINYRNTLHPRNQENVTLIAEISIQNQQIHPQETFPIIVHEREELVTPKRVKISKVSLTKVSNDDPKIKVRFSFIYEAQRLTFFHIT